MKLKIVILSTIFSLIPVSANAIYDGESATGDKYVVATYENGCSATAIAPRILAMAQHCPAIVGQTKYVYPGENKNSSKNAKVLATFVPTGNFLGGREYDIMLVIVDQELPVSSKIKIATEQDIARWRVNQTPIIVYGYGQTKSDTFSDTANKASFYISSLSDLGNGISPSYTSVLSLNPTNGTSQICNGDSGGPSYVFEDDQVFYVGANISSNKMNGCGSNPNSTTFARVQTLYPFMDLLTQANDWIEKNVPKPIIDPTQTIVCKKWLITKKIKGINPKCPKGYKLVK